MQPYEVQLADLAEQHFLENVHVVEKRTLDAWLLPTLKPIPRLVEWMELPARGSASDRVVAAPDSTH